ncbi:MAG: rhodanese-like domain-containing protein [Campylobacterota bacterium]|nr:rhodanese-like domain-containing protein [Campylobacterota bacterium]
MKVIIKNYMNILYWIAMAGLVIWFLYSKGWILANFESITAKQAYALMENNKNITLLDVRTIEEFKSHHVKDAKLIPLGNLAKELKELIRDKNHKILVYCQTGRRSVSASRTLEKSGFTPINIEGGIIAMKHVGFKMLK